MVAPAVLAAVAVAIGIIAAMFVAATALARYARRERSKEMGAVGAQLGYRYAAEADHVEALYRFGLLGRGAGHSATNVLRASVDGAAMTLFDWRYSDGQFRERSTRQQTVLLFESSRLDLPDFDLLPEGIGSKIWSLLGHPDIDVEGQPVFSAMYELRGPDEAAVRALFDGARCDFFARRPGLHVHGRGRWLLFYRPDRLVPPAEIAAFTGEGLAILDLLANDAPPPAGAPDPLDGLEALLAGMGVDGIEPS